MERLFTSLIMSLAIVVFASPSFAGTTCGAPIGEVVSFNAIINGKYVSADKNRGSRAPLWADRDLALSWEQFEVEDAGGGYIALKDITTDLYVSADLDASDGKLYADIDKMITGKLEDTERFFWITNTDGTVSLMLKINGKYVAAEDAGESQLVANRDEIRTWEKFTTTVTCPTTPPERFVDNGDGTITDNETGLMWEKKTAGDFDDPRSIIRTYSWTDPADGDETNPDGTAFTVFLSTLNQESTDDPDSACFAGYCDWRIPRLVELRSIRQEPCSDIACIDPIFGPTLVPGSPGPPLSVYMSSTSSATDPLIAWAVIFREEFGVTGVGLKTRTNQVRAVRSGP